jgi:predicted dehydrogenase
VRVAIIGCGSIGSRHLKNALSLGCQIGIEDTDSRTVAILQNHPGVHHCAEFFAPNDYDAAIISTPYDQHLTYAKMFIECKVPVFVEKPLGSLDQIEDWRRVVTESAGLVTQVGYQLRFHTVVRALRYLPPATSGRFSVDCDMRTWPGRSYGPPLLELSHEIDLAMSFGASGSVHSAVRGGSDGFHYEFSMGAWDFDLAAHSTGCYGRHWKFGGVSMSFHSPEALGDQMYRDELIHFLDCVRLGNQTDVPLSDGLRVLDVCAQVEAMARTHV